VYYQYITLTTAMAGINILLNNYHKMPESEKCDERAFKMAATKKGDKPYVGSGG
jgi:hypothetical protein